MKGNLIPPHESLNTIDADKFINFDISFEKFITDTQLINELPNYILIFFPPHTRSKNPIQFINIDFSLT